MNQIEVIIIDIILWYKCTSVVYNVVCRLDLFIYLIIFSLKFEPHVDTINFN